MRTVSVEGVIFYDLMNSRPHLYFSGHMIRNTGNIAKLNAYSCRYTDDFISVLMETVGTDVAAFFY